MNKKIIKKLRDLDELSARDIFKIIIKRIDPPKFSFSKEDEISYSNPIETSFCWRDTYENKEILITGEEGDFGYLAVRIIPKKWFNLEREKLILLEPKEFRYGNKKSWHLGYDVQKDGFDAGLIFRVIRGDIPKKEEIQRFRYSELYYNFFHKQALAK